MKTIGLIGGTTWLSTAEYYKILNQLVNKRLGGHNSAQLLLYSVNHEEYKPPADIKDWGRLREGLIDLAIRLESAGADCLVLCANTMHLIANDIQGKINIPLIHIAEETAKEIKKKGISKVGLLGTSITMEQPFFKDILSKYNIETLIPDTEERNLIHSSIFNEFGKGIFSNETKNRYLAIIESLRMKVAEGVILGCTEIPMLIKPEDCSIPTFDTTLIHATAAVEFALK
jgi:aspartate racemase